MNDDRRRLTTLVVATAFVVSIVGAIGFAAALLALDTTPSGDIQVLGVGLSLGLGGLGVGIIVWAKGLMPTGPDVEPRHAPRGDRADRVELEEEVASQAAGIGRRGLLGRLLAAASGVLGLSLLTPLRALGPDPFPERATTGWGPGRRVTREDGSRIRPDEVMVGSALLAFPEGREDEADTQVMLVRLDPDDLDTTSGTVDGLVAYSRVCTHLGCPVGLYQVELRRLLCPCHQSAFDVTRRAEPVFGPAARALPQLPLDVDGEGYLIATDDFPEPVGPSFSQLPQHLRQEGEA